MKRIVRYLTAWAWRHEIGVTEGMLKLKRLAADEKGIELELQQDPDAAKWVATCFASMVANAPNYTEMQFKLHTEYHGKFDWLTVTIQKFNGKTPHQKRVEAEEELATQKAVAETLAKENAYLRQQIPSPASPLRADAGQPTGANER